MLQLRKSNSTYKPTALACAISSLFITSSVIPVSAHAACTVSGSVTTCDTPDTYNYVLPATPSPTLNINGTQNYNTANTPAEWIYSINQALDTTTVNFNADLTWSNIQYKLVQTLPAGVSLIGGAINIGNTSVHQAVGGNVDFHSSQGSSITLDLAANTFNANESISLSGIIINATGNSASSLVSAILEGNVTINDVDRGGNTQRALLGTVIRASSANSDIKQSGTIQINGPQQSNSGSNYTGLTLQSYNYQNYAPTFSFNNSGTIEILMTGPTTGYFATGLDLDIIGTHNTISAENSGTIKLESTSTGASGQAVRIKNNLATNTINFKNTGTISNQYATNNPQANAAIQYSGPGAFSLINEGSITSHIITSDNQASTDTITNSGIINGNVSTFDGNDAFINTAGNVTGLINLGLGDDALTLSGGTLQQSVLLGDGNDTATISGGSAQIIDMEAGADTATWSGGSFTNFYGGDGADTLIISNGADWNNIQSINGANASGIDDTSIDTLAFTNFTGNYNATKSLNWEAVEARSNSRVTFTDPALVMSSALGAGLFARAGGSFVVNNGFNLTSALTIDAGGSYLFAPGSSTGASSSITGNVSNAGTLDIADSNTGSILTITGDYAGNNGTLRLRTNLGDDNSATSRLIISGAASGSTEVIVTNLGGSGAQTTDGIRIIETGTSSAGAFSLAGNYVSAGAFEYALVQRNDNSGDNWYLASTYVTPQPQQPTVTNPVYTPNLGAMLANQRTANVAFTSTLEDREGAAAYQLQGRENGPWVRYQARKNAFHSLDHLHTRGHSNIVQVGNTVLSLGSESRFDLGVMGGYADARSDSKHRLTQRKARSDLHGYSVGAYATWYAEPELKRGFYLDSWLLWNHFNNSISTSDEQKLSYKSKGVTASLEVGTHIQLMDNWWLQPQAQVVYQGVKADDYRDQQNVTIKSSEANYQTRLGAKTYLDISSANGADYRPYVELNWLHNSKPYAVEIASTDYTPNGMKNVGELKVGLEGKLNANNQVWINTLYAAGSDSQKDYGINLGWKYSF